MKYLLNSLFNRILKSVPNARDNYIILYNYKYYYII